MILKSEEVFIDNFGNRLVLPSRMRIVNCFYCDRTATRSQLTRWGGYKKYVEEGKLAILVGFVDNYFPICRECQDIRKELI